MSRRYVDIARLIASFHGVIICFLLSACSGVSWQPDPAVAQALPQRVQLTGMPFYPQVEDQCGPATLATMLAVRDVHVEPEALRGKVYIPGKSGAVTTEMVAHARQYGLLVYPLAPDPAAIMQEIAAGNPVLVLQNLGFSWMPRWHFSVVTGYDLDASSMTLRSGDDPERVVGRDLFLKTWSRAERWAAVIVQPHSIPASAQAEGFLQAAADLEQVGLSAAAGSAYEAALLRWPDNTVALFGAGNTAYVAQDYARAAQFFARYLDQQPGSAAGWNNYAYSLAQEQCRAQALVAVACARALDPAEPRYRDSEVEVRSLLGEGVAGSCQQALQCPAATASEAAAARP